ncbi:Rpp20 subunit of nuclear RNase MRP and P-domain-containing protein [Stachybotrys elegans]|uniref:Rpp20 subunit of nuclear RNase MRP and P-domain-containing protein n=1 Tax=Stachybotrys elegans TaxID=80388 RepID=A0A8K0WRJ4_9HYPO|nr:Rpp20 subunit of nuclear RNase MRP and P-domain-containing protein [Stachybotrys elegans]
MAGKTSSKQVPGTMTKLPPLPEGSKLIKRPLNRRQAPATSKSRIIYVSTGTPLLSAVNRVRKQLERSQRGASAAPKYASLHSRVEALQRRGAAAEADAGAGTVVSVMGTGKAVKKALDVASWFEQQADCAVSVRTRTVGTVDDVVAGEQEEEEEGGMEQGETRVRKLSCLEVLIRLK